LVISDIHGMLDLFKKSLNDNNYNPKEDILILLGDYIDRGISSFETIEYIKELQKEGKVIALRGNHEDMAITAYNSKLVGDIFTWHSNGAKETLDSYERNGKTLEYHIKWLKNLPLLYKEKKYFFSHAGINPYKTFDNQTTHDLVWTRSTFYLYPRRLPKKIVFGHTPFKKGHAVFSNGGIGIDGGAFYTGSLTTLIIDENGRKKFTSTTMENHYHMVENYVNLS
jgi:serine/threonine protein phosphatase 1